ncbi:MAG: hypothetical protein ACOX7H_04780 [Bacillota bacterium]|jgi:hypothetical protein
MFNFGFNGSNGCSGCGDGSIWGCLVNLIILLIVLEFLCNIINPTNCGGNCC